MFLCSAALAAGAAFSVAVPLQQPADVSYSGYVILRIRQPVWGLSCSERAAIVTRRFASMVNEGFRAQRRELPLPKAQVRRLPSTWAVLVGNVVLVTATEDDAAANKTFPDKLAALWADRMNHALDLAVSDIRRESGSESVADSWVIARILGRMERSARTAGLAGPGAGAPVCKADAVTGPKDGSEVSSQNSAQTPGLRARLRQAMSALW